MANGILDIFTIGFKSDGLEDFEKNLKNTEGELKKTEREIKDLNGILKELAKNGNQDSKAFKQFQKELDDAKKKAQNLTQQIDIMKNRSEYQLLKLRKNFSQLVKTLGSLAFTGIALKKSLDFYEQGEQLEFLAQKTGVAADKLQLLANVAKKYGGTTEGTAGSLEGLNTKEGRQTAAQAGITITDDSEKNLENIARKMETLGTTAQKLELAKTLGLDEATTRMVLEGTTKLNEQLKQAKKYQLFTPEDIQRMREYRQIESDIRLGIENIFGSIWRMLLPAITAVAKAVKKVTDWFVEHEGAAQAIAIFVGIAGAILGIATVIKIAAGAFALFNPTIAIILAIAAAITFLYLVIDDFIGFLQGRNSIIEELLEKWGYDTDALRKDIKQQIEDIKNVLKGLIDFGASSLKFFGHWAQTLGKIFKDAWEMIPEPLRKFMVGGFKIATMGSPLGGIWQGQQILSKYKKNNANAVPNGAISNYNQTQSINNNNAANTQSINQNTSSNVRSLNNSRTTSKKVDIQKIEINAQGSDGYSIYNQILDASSGLDNGMRA